MKLHLLTAQVDLFVSFLIEKKPQLHLYKYDLLKQIRNHWDSSAPDLAEMYNHALQSDVTRRWWNRPAYHPKEVMLLFMQMEPEYVRQAFKDLLDETKSVDRRVDRFQFYADELLRMYKLRNRASIVNHHYQDAMIISMYLAAHEPSRYTLYPGDQVFESFLHKLEATRGEVNLMRFFKVLKIVMNYLADHPRFNEIPELSLHSPDNLLIAHSCILYATDNWKNQTP